MDLVFSSPCLVFGIPWIIGYTHTDIYTHHQLRLQSIDSFLNSVHPSIHPSNTISEEADDYEYGAVDAPIGLAWGAGVLAVATALLPIAMQGGEEAFEEMKSQDADTWGTGNSNRLNKRR